MLRKLCKQRRAGWLLGKLGRGLGPDAVDSHARGCNRYTGRVPNRHHGGRLGRSFPAMTTRRFPPP